MLSNYYHSTSNENSYVIYAIIYVGKFFLAFIVDKNFLIYTAHVKDYSTNIFNFCHNSFSRLEQYTKTKY